MKNSLYASSWVFAMTLIACQSVPDLRHDSPYFSGFIGSKIVLNDTLLIAPGEVSVYMQRGSIIEFGSLDFYQPFCKFEINTMRQQSRSVQPDQFQIVNVVRDNSYVAQRGRILASFGDGLFFDEPEEEIYSTELYLYSKTQPDVRALTCSHWEISRQATHLSVNQIRNAMGSILTLLTTP